jgi:hypothetical protein
VGEKLVKMLLNEITTKNIFVGAVNKYKNHGAMRSSVFCADLC